MELLTFTSLVLLSTSCFVYCQTNANSRDPLLITLQDGQLRGKVHTSTNLNRTYYTYQGIPYAKPPLGPLRFEPPVPNDPWNGTLDASTNKSSCIQQTGIGSEDCLYINIYKPSTTGILPVMFWIYGGTFVSNDGTTYDPEYLVEQDVIFVSFNYRLDVFGYLSTGDEVVPGNMALKDCTLALEWVRDNIGRFGGDPDKITIFGESAGAVHVSLMLQSPRTEGLFRAAIMDSGTSLILWGLAREARSLAFQLGKQLDIETTNSTNLVEQLKDIDAQVLINNSRTLFLKTAVGGNILAGLPWAPVREPELEGAFFTNRSHEQLSQGNFHKVPVLLGRNSEEALLGETVPGLAKLLLEKFNMAPSNLIPVDMNVRGVIEKIWLGTQIKTRYFGLDLVIASNNKLVKFVNIDQFNRPIQETARLLSKFVPTYFYVFTYQGLLGVSFNRTAPGVAHAEELRYIFKYNVSDISAEDVLMRDRMVRMWTNFVKYTNPTPESDSLPNTTIWHPMDQNSCTSFNYLDISAEPKMKTNPARKEMQYWYKLYKKHGNPPYDTY